MKNDYLKRQLYLMSSLGLFYLIILALFSVPLLGVLAVVLIKGIIDYQYVVVLAGCVLLGLSIFWLFRLMRRLFHAVGEQGVRGGQYAPEAIHRGQPVKISVFNGLITLTYGGAEHYQAPPAFPLPPQPPDLLMLPQQAEVDIISRLKMLSELKAQGVIDEAEFLGLKRKLMAAEVMKTNEP